MTNPILTLGGGNWAIKENNLLGYTVYNNNYIADEFVYTRADANATVINKDGSIGKACYNLLQRSEEFDNAYWTTTRATITPDIAIAPNGTLTADLLKEDTSVNLTHYNQRFIPFNPLDIYNYSCYLKSSVRTKVQLNIYNGSSDNFVTFDLIQGTTSDTSTSTITSVGNGWYRCSVVRTMANMSSNLAVQIVLTNGTTNIYTGDGTSGIYIWGAQLTLGSTLLPYLKTTNRQNIPRIDYSLNNTTPNLLIEPSRSNLFLNSVFAGSAGTPTNWTVGFNSGTASTVNSIISSGNTAYRLQTSASRVIFYQTQTYVTGSSYSISCYVENVITPIPVNDMLFHNGDATLTAQTYTQNGIIISSSTLVQSGFRYNCIWTPPSGITQQARVGNGVGGNRTGDITISCPQFESTTNQPLYNPLTSYIPTTTTTLTRNSDSMSLSNVPHYIGQSSGTIFIAGQFISRGLSLIIDDGTTTNSIFIFNISSIIGANFLSIQGNITISGTSYGTSTSITNNVGVLNKKIAIVYDLNNNYFKLFINGALSQTVTTNGLFTQQLTRIQIGSLSEQSMSLINNFNTYNVILTDTEAINLTT